MNTFDSYASSAASPLPDVETSPIVSSSRMPNAARAISAQLSRAYPPTNAFCVTLYNEDATSLRRTLESICRALAASQELAHCEGAYSTVCIIADGKDHVSQWIFDWMRLARVITPEGAVEDSDVETYSSFHQLGRLIHCAQAESRPQASTSMSDVQVIVCFKRRNKGKLDSHAVFFNEFCRMLRPRFCYQIDTGTTLDVRAVTELTYRLETCETTAAVAPRVLTEIPEERASLMTEWQFADLAYRNSVHWSAESLTSFLSVIPGQTGVFRWDALRSETTASDDVVTAYLQGAGEDGPVTRTTYLAEDRVIGILLMFANRRDWRLEYAPAAIATTDSCHSWGELLRQRRRWNNSAFACRLWLLDSLFSSLRHSNKPLRDKVRILIAAGLQALVGIREFAIPANIMALTVILAHSLGVASPPPLRVTCAAFWLVTLLNLILECAVSFETAQASSSLLAHFCVATRWFSALLFLATIALMPFATATLLLLPALSLIAIFLTVPTRALPRLVRSQFSPFQYLGIQLMLQAYAFWRLDDISWGTKGLRESNVDRPTLYRLRGFRGLVVSAWAAFNVLLCYFVMAGGSLWSESLGWFLEVCCITDASLSVLAVAYLLKRRFARSK
jgi:chitin synthase